MANPSETDPISKAQSSVHGPSSKFKGPCIKRYSILKYRTLHTRWFAIGLLPIVLVTQPVWQPNWLNQVMDVMGVLSLATCCIGRIWCSMYIGGRKKWDLVVDGPYSVVRNPLYVFSLIGVIGIALLSGVMTLLVIAPIGFMIYYRNVVSREEASLTLKHGDAYHRYLRTVPRWFPKFFLWHDASVLAASPRAVLAHIRDNSTFFLALVFFEGLELLRLVDTQIVLLRLP